MDHINKFSLFEKNMIYWWRVSPRLGGARLGPGRAGGRAGPAGWPPGALARQPRACAALALPALIKSGTIMSKNILIVVVR